MRAPRIFVDFMYWWQSPRNSERRAVGLIKMGTREDLAKAGVVLHEGLSLIVYEDSDEHEDVEADATVYYDTERGEWFAELDPGFRYLPRLQ